MRTFALTLSLLLWTGVEASTHRGSCADNSVQGKSNFKQNQIEGRWYEIAKDRDFFDASQSCQSNEISTNSDGTLSVARHGYSLSGGWDQKVFSAIKSANNRGEYITYSEGETPDKNAETDFSYVATDYDNWLIEYVCVDIVPNSYYIDSVSIKSRQTSIDDSTLELITGVVEGLGYDSGNLYFVHQCKICPYNTIPLLQ